MMGLSTRPDKKAEQTVEYSGTDLMFTNDGRAEYTSREVNTTDCGTQWIRFDVYT
jgi:hypothetical protein